MPNMETFLKIENIKLWARVGVLQKERDLGQIFSLDLFLWNDFKNCTLSDDIKETTSVTSSATENEFTITGKIEVSLEDNKGNIIIQNKVFSLSKDHKFSSSNINSSESEENTIKSDIEKYLQIQVLNLVRSRI